MARKRAAPWGNRIVGHGTSPASSFMANPLNWRTHGPAQEAVLTGLLNDVGFVAPVVINRRSDPGFGQHRNEETMLDGHLRVTAALARGDDTPVPWVMVDLDPEEERRVLLQLDPIGGLAGRDEAVLAPLVEQVVADWPAADLDLEALLKRDRKAAKGLAHDVKECTCCKKGCSPGCGCYREAGEAARYPRRHPRRARAG